MSLVIFDCLAAERAGVWLDDGVISLRALVGVAVCACVLSVASAPAHAQGSRLRSPVLAAQAGSDGTQHLEADGSDPAAVDGLVRAGRSGRRFGAGVPEG